MKKATRFMLIILVLGPLLGSITSCKNPLQAIIALDVFKPDIVVRVDGTDIPSGEGTYTFVSTSQGTIENVTFTIANEGAGTLTLNPGPVEITGNDASAFATLAQPEDLELGTDEETSFTVSFDASTSRTYTAELRVTSDDPDEGEYVITVQATIGPELQILFQGIDIDLSGGSYNAGTVYYNDPVNLTYTVRNVGTANLVFEDATPVEISGTAAASISITQPSQTIAPSQSETFTLEVDPANLGNLQVNVSILSNDSDEGNASYSVDLTALHKIPSGRTDISNSSENSMALAGDGSIWAWGDNFYGQLGDGTEDDSTIAVHAIGISNAVAIDAGERFSVALVADGSLMSWGYNGDGQLGIGSSDSNPHSTPAPATGLSDVVAIAAGGSHTVALKNDGTVWAWGRNSSGQLGDSTNDQSSDPVQVTDLYDVVSIKAGMAHTLALKTDGTVWAWGKDDFGELGDDISLSSKNSPVQVAGITDATIIAAGGFHSAAVLSDGSVKCWGNNSDGQLGNNDAPTNAPTPVDAASLSGIIAIDAGGYFTYAKKSDGSFYAWGSNTSGQYGDGTTSGGASETPKLISGLDNYESFSIAGTVMNGGAGHTVAIDDDGSVWGWGWNTSGQIGDGTTVSPDTPVATKKDISAVSIAAGEYFSMAALSDGSVWSWGENTAGCLGDGSTTQRESPVQVINLTGVGSVAAGSTHSLAKKSDGTVWSWGYNFYGQLGIGSSDSNNHTIPVQINGLNNIDSVEAGYHYSAAIESDGTVWAWGRNDDGNLGDGTQDDHDAPVELSGISGVDVISAGGSPHSATYGHTLAIVSNDVYAWGNNDYGQFGDGTTNPSDSPVDVSFGSVASVATGFYHSIGITTSGWVYGWGSNNSGQIGDGSTTQRESPVRESSNMTTGAAAAAGGYFTVVITTDGDLWSWGNNGNGQLGDGTTDNSIDPVDTGVTQLDSIAAGRNHVLAIKTDGTVWSWGDNDYGQLGIGTADTSPHSTPSWVKFPLFVE